MPFRGMARMTGGIMNMAMLDGVLMIVNGKFFKGIRHVLRERKKMLKASKSKLEINSGSSGKGEVL